MTYCRERNKVVSIIRMFSVLQSVHTGFLDTYNTKLLRKINNTVVHCVPTIENIDYNTLVL